MANKIIADTGAVSGVSGFRYEIDASGAIEIYTGAGVLAATISADQVLTLAKPPVGVFPSGTAMLFAQTAAPTGWTKSTTHDNKALRVVSGTAGSGGSVPFTTAFASKTPSGSVSVSGSVGSTTLDASMIPSHNHMNGRATENLGLLYGRGPDTSGYRDSLTANTQNMPYTSSTGGGGAHNHSFSGSGSFTGSAIDLTVQYVDTIIATKD